MKDETRKEGKREKIFKSKACWVKIRIERTLRKPSSMREKGSKRGYQGKTKGR